MVAAGRPRREPEAMGYKVAVVGATGNVGREMMNVLAEREFPVDEIYALASRRSVGTEVSFGDKTIKCQDLATFDFSKVDICLMSAGSGPSKEYSPKIGASGCIVVQSGWTEVAKPGVVSEPVRRSPSWIASKTLSPSPT